MVKSFCISLLILTAFAGCRSIKLEPTGQMVAVYQFGQFQMLLNTNNQGALRAAQKATQQFELYQSQVTLHRYDSELLTRAPNDQKVTIRIAEVNSQQTLLSIRWGEGGDLPRSRRLYEAIENNLK
jgi:hypothetical protein